MLSMILYLNFKAALDLNIYRCVVILDLRVKLILSGHLDGLLGSKEYLLGFEKCVYVLPAK